MVIAPVTDKLRPTLPERFQTGFGKSRRLNPCVQASASQKYSIQVMIAISSAPKRFVAALNKHRFSFQSFRSFAWKNPRNHLNIVTRSLSSLADSRQQVVFDQSSHDEVIQGVKQFKDSMHLVGRRPMAWYTGVSIPCSRSTSQRIKSHSRQETPRLPWIQRFYWTTYITSSSEFAFFCLQ